MNSFRSVERAITYEIERQAAALDAGEPLVMETRGWSDDRGDDVSHAVEGDVRRLPLLPGAGPAAAARRSGLARPTATDAARAAGGPARRGTARPGPERRTTRPVLVADPDATRAVRGDAGGRPGPRPRSPSRPGSPGSTCASATPAIGAAGRVDPARARRASSRLVADGSHLAGERPRGPRDARGVGRRRPRRSSPRAGSPRSPTRAPLDALIDDVFAANPAAVADYHAGKPQAVGFLVGQVMKATRGPGQCGPRPAAVRARLDGSTALTVGALNLLLWARGHRPDRRRAISEPADRGALPGAQGPGRERRSLRVVARRRPRRRQDRRVGRDGAPAATGADRRGHRHRRGRARLPRLLHPLAQRGEPPRLCADAARTPRRGCGRRQAVASAPAALPRLDRREQIGRRPAARRGTPR